jgi:hypothetical protein
MDRMEREEFRRYLCNNINQEWFSKEDVEKNRGKHWFWKVKGSLTCFTCSRIQGFTPSREAFHAPLTTVQSKEFPGQQQGPFPPAF